MAYSKNVFINCPFDDDYYSLLKPIIFTVLYCGLKPRISETKDGDAVRIHSIQQLIEQSKYSIHDLSRIEVKTLDDLPRFNMPFELGIDIGCKKYKRLDKKCLILEEKPFRIKAVLSDIAGQDISSHENDPIIIVKCVRDWIYKIKNANNKPVAYTIIWDLYHEFNFDFNQSMRSENQDPDKMWEIPFSELIQMTSKWISGKKNP